jgi:hypothetical protein
MQMYCTFVLFVNQHFLGLPTSGTHCILLSTHFDDSNKATTLPFCKLTDEFCMTTSNLLPSALGAGSMEQGCTPFLNHAPYHYDNGTPHNIK